MKIFWFVTCHINLYLLQNLCLNKVDRFVRSYDGTKSLTLFGSQKYNDIYNRIKK